MKLNRKGKIIRVEGKSLAQLLAHFFGGFFKFRVEIFVCTECPRSLGPFHVVNNCVEWAKTSWPDSMFPYFQDT